MGMGRVKGPSDAELAVQAKAAKEKADVAAAREKSEAAVANAQAQAEAMGQRSASIISDVGNRSKQKRLLSWEEENGKRSIWD